LERKWGEKERRREKWKENLNFSPFNSQEKIEKKMGGMGVFHPDLPKTFLSQLKRK
jgi:hypothetical protein